MKINRNFLILLILILQILTKINTQKKEKKEKISTTNIISLRNCYIKEAAQRICENFGRKITYIMFADFIKNKIPERALINQGVDFYLKYYNWPQIEKLLIEGIGKENKKAIDDINNEINKLRNKKVHK